VPRSSLILVRLRALLFLTTVSTDFQGAGSETMSFVGLFSLGARGYQVKLSTSAPGPPSLEQPASRALGQP
jgi:hypothetical protein